MKNIGGICFVLVVWLKVASAKNCTLCSPVTNQQMCGVRANQEMRTFESACAMNFVNCKHPEAEYTVLNRAGACTLTSGAPGRALRDTTTTAPKRKTTTPEDVTDVDERDIDFDETTVLPVKEVPPVTTVGTTAKVTTTTTKEQTEITTATTVGSSTTSSKKATTTSVEQQYNGRNQTAHPMGNSTSSCTSMGANSSYATIFILCAIYYRILNVI